MVKRKIKQAFQVSNIRYGLDAQGLPTSLRVTLDTDSRGLTNKEYITDLISSTVKWPVVGFDYTVIEEEAQAA